MFLGLFKKNVEPVQKVEYFENDLGKFKKGKFGETDTLYTGSIDWCDKENDVEADVICEQDNIKDRDDNFEYLRKILADTCLLDQKLKEYIADENVENDGLIYIWGDGYDDTEPEPISREEFISKLHLSYIRVYVGATAEFVFPAEGLFTDHDLVVRVSNDLSFSECVLEG